jgi:hypothetical protein
MFLLSFFSRCTNFRCILKRHNRGRKPGQIKTFYPIIDLNDVAWKVHTGIRFLVHRKLRTPNMPLPFFKRLIDVVAFANAGNIGEFQALMERHESPQRRHADQPAAALNGQAPAAVVFCVIPRRITQQ